MIRRIEQAYAIGDDRVSVIVRSERLGGHAPNALIVFLHRERLGHTFDRNGDFLDVGTSKAERDATIGMDLRRNQRRRRLRWSGSGQEQDGGHKESSFHGSSRFP